MESVKNVILVLSGKGGVGKSTVATQIALGLVAKGKKVGLLDVDLCGPSIPRMLNLKGKDVYQCSEGWVPVYTDESKMLAVMSIGFLLGDQDDAVVWRGPKKNGMIKQFLTEVFWQDVDYLVIDTPPGTTDEHITVVETLRALKPLEAVVVTTPQNVATADVRRELTFCKKTKIHVLGIVENMSGFVCPNCENCTNIFSSGGGESLAAAVGVPFIGTLPLDPRLTKSLEEGSNFLVSDEGSRTHESILKVVDKLLETSLKESS